MAEGQLFDPNPEVWKPDLPIPTDEEHEILMSDPDARAERMAQRIGSRVLPFLGHIRGRRRNEFIGPGQLDLEYSGQISDEEIARFARSIAPRQPLFNKFSKGYRVGSNKESIDSYVMRMGQKSKQHEGDLRTREERRQAKMRQTHHILDKLQQKTLVERDTAALRRWSIAAVQKAINNESPIDEQAIVYAADAVSDFGHTLLDDINKGLIRDTKAKKIADNTLFIGAKAVSHPEYFINNLALLRMVRLEQKARFEYWDRIYSATAEHYGDRLTKQDKENAAANAQEISRLHAIVNNA